jgi:dTDP-glucose 4,6-dehydratase
MKLLVTGGCGFIGSNFIMFMLEKYHDVHIVNLDLLTYAGNLSNVRFAPGYEGRYEFIRGDISDSSCLGKLAFHGFDAIVNFAAESHVDRSIMDASDFVRTNVGGTQTLLDFSRDFRISRFLQISTDEVYGSLTADDPPFTESNHLRPNSPYAASKAAADLLVRAYHKTYGLDVVITRCSNNYGPFQFPEKLVPLMITNALHNQALPVYGDGMNVRDWIHVKDHCRAIDLVIRKGVSGEVYNVGGQSELQNIRIVKAILKKLDRPQSLITLVKDRPGHDRRYAMNFDKLSKELGWRPEISFQEGLSETIEWYIGNENWWKEIKSGDYLQYYEKWYGLRTAD